MLFRSGTLFFDIAKGLKIKQPNFAVLENVKGLISHDKGNTLETILESLQELGYYVNIEVYNSKDFGVPQNRERIIFICKHIKTLMQDGENLNLNISRQIISEYRSEEHTSELQSHSFISYAVFCLKKKNRKKKKLCR